MRRFLAAVLAALSSFMLAPEAFAQSAPPSLDAAKSATAATAASASSGLLTVYAGLPLWAWIAIALVILLLLIALIARRRRQAVITTRLG